MSDAWRMITRATIIKGRTARATRTSEQQWKDK